MVELGDYSDGQLRITRDGSWFYGANEITRPGLIRLFYQFLFLRDGQHQIITPAERVPVVVEDTPYIVNNIIEREPGCLALLLNDETQIELHHDHLPYTDSRGILLVAVRNGLLARFRQSCHIELGLRLNISEDGRYYLDNCGERIFIEGGPHLPCSSGGAF